MVKRKIRVGATFPGRITVNWPLLRLQFDEQGFELTAARVLRKVIVRALGYRSGQRATDARLTLCRWSEVASVRLIVLGAEVRLRSGDSVRIFSLAPGRVEAFVNSARLDGGVMIEERGS